MAKEKRPFVDFGAIRDRITIEQVLEHYGVLNTLKRNGIRPDRAISQKGPPTIWGRADRGLQRSSTLPKRKKGLGFWSDAALISFGFYAYVYAQIRAGFFASCCEGGPSMLMF